MKKLFTVFGGIILILIIGASGYYGFISYKEYREEQEKIFLNNKNKECYDAIQKVKADYKKDGTGVIIEQFYSPKLGTCVYSGGALGKTSSDKISWMQFQLVEIYSGKVLERETLCKDKDSCEKLTTDTGSLMDETRDKIKDKFNKSVEPYR